MHEKLKKLPVKKTFCFHEKLSKTTKIPLERVQSSVGLQSLQGIYAPQRRIPRTTEHIDPLHVAQLKLTCHLVHHFRKDIAKRKQEFTPEGEGGSGR